MVILFDRSSGRQSPLTVEPSRNSEDDSGAPGWASFRCYFLLWINFQLVGERAIFLVGETAESTPKVDLHLRFCVIHSFIMFGYQLVKRFPSPGYEVWEVWREHYLSTGMKLGWTEEEMMKWLPTKSCGWALNAVSDLPRGYWRSTAGKQAWTLTETLYQFDIRLSDTPVFYERSYNSFVRGKMGSRVEVTETSDTVDQRPRQQCSQRQVIDTRSSTGNSLIDQFRQSGGSSEGFGISSSCSLSRRGAFGKDLSGEVEDMSIAESGSRIRIPGDGDEVQTGPEVEFTEEVFRQINQKIYGAALSEYENCGFRKIPTEDKIIERSVESCGPDEHHAMKKDCVLSPESEEISDEQSDDEYWFQDVSDTVYSDVEELDVDDSRSETGFAASLNSVACDNVTAIASDFGGGVKASRDDMLGAWALMELKTGGVDQKFCNSTMVADETQMCTTECTVDTLENWKSSGIDRPLVSETQKGQNDKAASDRSNFAQLGRELEEWVQSQLSESQLNTSVCVEPTDEHQWDSVGVDGTGKSDQTSMAKVLHSWVQYDQQPRREDSSLFPMEVEQKVERRVVSRFPEIARLLLVNRSLSRKVRWSRLEASGKQSWQPSRRNGSYSGRSRHPFKHQRKKVFMYGCTSV